MIGTMVLAPQLLRLRLDRGLSQKELAKRSGVARTTIMRAEAGHQIYPSTLRKLAEALGVTPATLRRQS